MKAIVSMLVLVLTVSWIDESQCYVCGTCIKECEPLPDNCESGRRICGCCDVCRGKVGDSCDNLSVPCESALVCRSADGVDIDDVIWYDFDFRGTCQEKSK